MLITVGSKHCQRDHWHQYGHKHNICRQNKYEKYSPPKDTSEKTLNHCLVGVDLTYQITNDIIPGFEVDILIIAISQGVDVHRSTK